ncbi:MAG: dephospho-CoA kinase, partial [Gammaproteobacteria bacterium]|nr:dephospho-CoA kinase [Gammaproteobacteria bacterium]NIR98334.1 dephospho-CoA kinase [Gammaproteobacteria bacterium]NIT64081.1 dephospho-CoA kinase [Gammaproteobacteria bacterium]NIV21012.1 dephospho-CoA kinase [Gammaproteobacteria bacterium]NIX10409.1 dephospho-CoA kinase [Gammaproteobacteria bacterium]
MLIVGLTGGIGSGKSTAAEMFHARGVPVIDADALARELVRPGMPALEEIVRIFGRDVLDAEGRLDRAQLADMVFTDAGNRRRLEQILHPRIRRAMQERLRELKALYCILVIPLLLETGQTGLVHRVLVVDADPEIQAQRAARRGGVSRERVEAIMTTQASRE